MKMRQTRRAFYRLILSCVGGLLTATTIVGYGATANAGALPQEDTKYRIKAEHSGLFLDVLNESQRDGANVGQWEWKEGGSENDPRSKERKNNQWTFHYIKDTPPPQSAPLYHIKAVHSGGLLTVFADIGNSMIKGDRELLKAPRANVGVWSPEPIPDAENQMWELMEQKDGTFKIRNAHSGLFLDVWGRDRFNGGNVVQYSDDPGKQQRWSLEKLKITRSSNNARAIGPVMGAWEHLCQQFCDVLLTTEIKTTKGDTIEMTQETKDSLTHALEVGVEFSGVKAGGSISKTQEQTVGSNMAKSVSEEKTVGNEKKVALTLEQMKAHDLFAVWQWKGTTEMSDGSHYVVYSAMFTCTPDGNPPNYLPGSKEDLVACK